MFVGGLKRLVANGVCEAVVGGAVVVGALEPAGVSPAADEGVATVVLRVGPEPGRSDQRNKASWASTEPKRRMGPGKRAFPVSSWCLPPARGLLHPGFDSVWTGFNVAGVTGCSVGYRGFRLAWARAD